MARDFLFDWLMECFRDLVIGRNVKGIIHNLNGPLQILSMQLELLNMDLERCKSDVLSMKKEAIPSPEKCGQLTELLLKTAERVAQLQEVVQKVDLNLRVVGLRSGGEPQDNPVPTILNHLVQEELEFWKSDLFFKHQVALDLKLPDSSPVVVVKEKGIRDIFDSIMMACLEQIRGEEVPSISIECGVVEKDDFFLTFTHNGVEFDLAALEECQAASEKRMIPQHITPAVMALYMARGWSGQLGLHLSISHRKVALSSTISPD